MALKNNFAKRSRISEARFRQLIKLFSLDLEAVQIEKITGLSHVTVLKYLKAIRERIAAYCKELTPFSGDIEVDESYFGAHRVKGKRGRGAYGKTIVFGLLKRNGKVYTEIVPNVSRKTLQSIISGKVTKESTIHSDGFLSYDGLVDLGYKKHYRVQHGKNEFANEKSHINGIESFWGYAKTRLSRFRGIPRNTFFLHLKECEFRFNYREENLYLLLLKILRKSPINYT